MAISPQQLTIYLYRAVIFAIAQLSCYVLLLHFRPSHMDFIV